MGAEVYQMECNVCGKAGWEYGGGHLCRECFEGWCDREREVGANARAARALKASQAQATRSLVWSCCKAALLGVGIGVGVAVLSIVYGGAF